MPSQTVDLATAAPPHGCLNANKAKPEAIRKTARWELAVREGFEPPAGPVGPNGPGLRAFATPAALTAAAPQFAGQMAIVTSTNALYRGTGTTAGAWTLIPTTAGQ
jgi:hypothetical protein